MPIVFHPITDELKPTSWKPTPPPAVRPAPRSRKYVLRDGDSLERLAERFLGNRTRAEEIFAMNRHVLTRADLLPVGAQIVLPPRTEATDK
jgi:nucleoid-associated protein YgaU